MKERYTIAITPHPGAGPDMISILIIDTMPESGKSEVFSAIVHRKEKNASLQPYLEKFGKEAHLIDLTMTTH